MKKFAAVVAVAVLVAFAAPAFAAINPFMDVPMNHWAYDAIGQLAAHGILSGYPDGTYKGKQPTTRYEMASALARALAVVDMTKASKQDVQLLQRLVVEFKDELEALGVRVDDLDERVSLIESRLGGWKISGHLRLDITNEDKDAPDASSSSGLSRARLNIERWFGDPDNPMHFYGRIDDGDANWSKFFVDVPFFGGTTLTAGRFADDWGADYYMGGNWGAGVGDYSGLDSVLTDRTVDGLKITKNFGLGSFIGYVTHVDMENIIGKEAANTFADPAKFNLANPVEALEFLVKDARYTVPFYQRRIMGVDDNDKTLGAWELFMMGKLQFTEKIGLDLGLQAFLGDNAEYLTAAPATAPYLALRFNNLWTLFAGLRITPIEGVNFKAIYYHQKMNGEGYALTLANPLGEWLEFDYSDAAHWRVLFEISQDVLKYTSAWLEYGRVDQGFISPVGSGAFFANKKAGNLMSSHVALQDFSYYRIILAQQWTPKIGTYLFYYGYKADYDWDDMAQWGLGVTYKYNDNVKFGLNFLRVDYKDNWWMGNDPLGREDETFIRFRTDITF